MPNQNILEKVLQNILKNTVHIEKYIGYWNCNVEEKHHASDKISLNLSKSTFTFKLWLDFNFSYYSISTERHPYKVFTSKYLRQLTQVVFQHLYKSSFLVCCNYGFSPFLTAITITFCSSPKMARSTSAFCEQTITHKFCHEFDWLLIDIQQFYHHYDVLTLQGCFFA